jgi:hypothetical protein
LSVTTIRMARQSDEHKKRLYHDLLFQSKNQFIISVLSFLFLFGIIWNRTTTTSIITTTSASTSAISSSFGSNVRSDLKILYIMTSLAEYDSGRRYTSDGFDRFKNTLIPVLIEGVESMLSIGYSVDVALVCHYTLKPERRKLLKQALPLGVSLQVWDDATPIGYKLEDKKGINHTQQITRALARQHRFIIKDKLQYYDFFVNFEDDMLIKGQTVQHYADMTQELYRLREMAPEVASIKGHPYYGPMTKAQLRRVIPGLMRVEVLLNETDYGSQETLDMVPVTNRPQIDPQPCCHLSAKTVSNTRPAAPASDKLFLWETGIRALGLRKFPLQSSLGWVVMLRGPRESTPNLRIGDYWSGSDGYFGAEQRPDTKAFASINNQGGWMATREQIWEWHTEICPGGFLPPFDSPEFSLDGLDMRNVEYWSGGMEIFTKEHGCNLQRVVSLDPDRFARQLLYHTANNKQRQLHRKRRIFTKVNDLLGQLNTVRKNAEAEMDRRVRAMSKALHQ